MRANLINNCTKNVRLQYKHCKGFLFIYMVYGIRSVAEIKVRMWIYVNHYKIWDHIMFCGNGDGRMVVRRSLNLLTIQITTECSYFKHLFTDIPFSVYPRLAVFFCLWESFWPSEEATTMQYITLKKTLNPLLSTLVKIFIHTQKLGWTTNWCYQ